MSTKWGKPGKKQEGVTTIIQQAISETRRQWGKTPKGFPHFTIFSTGDGQQVLDVAGIFKIPWLDGMTWEQSVRVWCKEHGIAET